MLHILLTISLRAYLKLDLIKFDVIKFDVIKFALSWIMYLII